jgi:hypothetical protein
MDEAELLGDRVLLVARGQVRASGSVCLCLACSSLLLFETLTFVFCLSFLWQHCRRVETTLWTWLSLEVCSFVTSHVDRFDFPNCSFCPG